MGRVRTLGGVLALTVLAGAAWAGGDVPEVRKARWTVMVYQLGRKYEPGQEISEEMRRRLAHFTGNKRYPGIEFRAESEAGGTRYRYRGSEWEFFRGPGTRDSLPDFLRWAMKDAPAERYALVLQGQGRGSYGYDLPIPDFKAPRVGRETGIMGMAGQTRASSLPLWQSRDLSPIGLRVGLEAGGLGRNRPLDLLLLGSSMPPGIEGLVELADVTRTVVSSPVADYRHFSVPAPMQDLIGNPNLTPEELSRRVVRHHAFAAGAAKDARRSVIVSAWRMSKVRALAARFSRWVRVARSTGFSLDGSAATIDDGFRYPGSACSYADVGRLVVGSVKRYRGPRRTQLRSAAEGVVQGFREARVTGFSSGEYRLRIRRDGGLAGLRVFLPDRWKHVDLAGQDLDEYARHEWVRTSGWLWTIESLLGRKLGVDGGAYPYAS